MVHKLHCSMACGIFPDQGWNPHLPNWQVDSSPLSHQGSPTRSLLCTFQQSLKKTKLFTFTPSNVPKRCSYLFPVPHPILFCWFFFFFKCDSGMMFFLCPQLTPGSELRPFLLHVHSFTPVQSSRKSSLIGSGLGHLENGVTNTGL